MKSGVNLYGYIRSESGIGQSCRFSAGSLQTTEIPFGIRNLPIRSLACQDFSWLLKETRKPLFNTNLFHINADELWTVFEKHVLPPAILKGRYNIGYWHWELPDFPEEWVKSFSLVDEVWVPSHFIFHSISEKSSIPVIKIPHGIQIDVPQGMDRNYFGLPQKPFLFCMMYSTLSYQERKNPEAGIQAFQQAFNHNDESVGLVIKITSVRHPDPKIERVKEMVQDCSNIYVIDEIQSRSEVNGLLNEINCFLSLHRAEGFGLSIAEAMYLGKPVIATNWSGNTDFINKENSFPVNYKLKPIEFDCGPYKAGQLWAEPDTEHAAYIMRKLLSSPELGSETGSRGQQYVFQHFSPQIVGGLMKDRLRKLDLI